MEATPRDDNFYKFIITDIPVEEKLDIVLDRVKNLKSISIQDITNCFTCNIMEYESLINHLENTDGLIKNDVLDTKDRKIYGLTVKGMLFEGYVNRKKKEARTETLQMLAIWVTAIGTGLSGLYVLAKFILWLYGN